jgi:hypothetical protein
MRATLFFAMLRDGKAVRHRSKMRGYYELCRVSAYPQYVKESQQELLQYYWDSSQSEDERARAEDFRYQAEDAARRDLSARPAAENSAVLDLFKAANRRHLDG